MDKYFDNFAGFGPAIHRSDVPAEKVAKFRGKLPDQLIAYWEEYGWCGYADGLFWTVDPDEYEPVLEAWLGNTPLVERDSYYVIARSVFGKIFLWGERTGDSLSINAPYGWIFPNDTTEDVVRRGLDKSIQLFFSSKSREPLDFKDSNEKHLFTRAFAKLGPLKANEMYGFEPALALGGANKLENLRKVDAVTHLVLLAELGEKKIMADINKVVNAAGLR